MGLFDDDYDIITGKRKKTKAQKRRGALTPAMKSKIMITVEGKCEAPKCKNKTYEVHHIKEVSKGGTNTPANLIALCRNCHGDVHDGVLKTSVLRNAVSSRSKKKKEDIKGILSKRAKVSRPKKKDPFGSDLEFGAPKKKGGRKKKDDIFGGFL